MMSCFPAGVGRQTHYICGQRQDLLLQSCEATSLWIWRLPNRWQAQGSGCSRPAPEDISRSGMFMLFDNVRGGLLCLQCLSLEEWGPTVLVKDSQTAVTYHQALIRWLGFHFLILEMEIKTQNKTSCASIVNMKWRGYEKYFVGYKALSAIKLRNSGLGV